MSERNKRERPPEIVAAAKKLGPARVATIEMIAEVIGPYIKSLQDRITKLESLEALRYAGVWDSKTSYGRGAAVTDKGGLWVTKDITAPGERPGESSKFQLAVKRGRAE